MINRVRVMERMKYSLRYKHRSGHRIHSPYVYNLVRYIFMKKRSFSFIADAELTVALCQLGLKYDYSYRIGQFYKYNNFNNYTINPTSYSGEDLIVFSHIDKQAEEIIKELSARDKRGAVIVLNIYRQKECRDWWKGQNELSLDLYRLGIVIYDKDLNKEYFKLKI